MTQGIDYFDKGIHVFDGFSFGLYGKDSGIEFVPTGLVYPEITNDPGQIVVLKVVLTGGSFRGELVFDFPWSAMMRFRLDLEQWDREGIRGFTFPTPQTMRFIPPFVVECTVKHPPWSTREWQCHCCLSNCESADNPNVGLAAALEVRFMLNIESVDLARRDLSDFLRHVSTMAK